MQEQSTVFPFTIERIGTLSTVIASFSLIVSVFYDWGFMSALGLRFSEIPTSVTDHVRSWLVWLPNVAIGVFGIIAVEMLSRRIERGMTEDEIIRSSSNPLRTEKMRNRPFYVAGFAGVLIVVLWLLFGDRFHEGLQIGLIITWFLFSHWVFGHPTVRARHSQNFRLFVHWLPPIIIWFYFSGFNDATSQINSTPPMDVLQIKTSQRDASAIQAHILRSFEQWFLVQDANKQILWIRSDDVIKIESHPVKKPFRGIACGLFDELCFPQTVPPGK